MNLKELRQSAGLTQQALATEAGCSMAYVALLESGLSPRKSDVLPRIMGVLDSAVRERQEAAASSRG